MGAGHRWWLTSAWKIINVQWINRYQVNGILYKFVIPHYSISYKLILYKVIVSHYYILHKFILCKHYISLWYIIDTFLISRGLPLVLKMSEKECISLFLRPFFDIEESGVDLRHLCPYGRRMAYVEARAPSQKVQQWHQFWEEISGGEGSVYLEDIWDTPGSEGALHHSVCIPSRDITFVERAHNQTVQDLFKYLQGLYSLARNFALKFLHSTGIIPTYYL